MRLQNSRNPSSPQNSKAEQPAMATRLLNSSSSMASSLASAYPNLPSRLSPPSSPLHCHQSPNNVRPLTSILSASPRRRGNIWSALTIDTEDRETANDDTTESVRGWEKWVIKTEQGFNVLLTNTVIVMLDAIYADRHYARFYVLETIARVPYFAFLSVLHMYESFGWWRRADYLKVHFAESWNELHHLLVMEALGGDERWFDRFLAQHIAVAYFLLTALMYTISPRMAYHFSECVEKHAYTTYDKFIKQHGEELKKLPAPEVAVKYYTEGDLYMFDEFQTNRVPESRRPRVDNLYDVFVNIREDEGEHCKTMHACQMPGNLRSPHTISSKDKTSIDDVRECVLPPAECNGILECITTSSSFASRAQKLGAEIPDKQKAHLHI